jgi:hypothetical protein
MELRPGEDEAQLPTAEAAVDDLEIVDPDLCFAFGVAGVEMREAVIVEEHRDRDPKEAADRRHSFIMPLAAVVRSGAARHPAQTGPTIAGSIARSAEIHGNRLGQARSGGPGRPLESRWRRKALVGSNPTPPLCRAMLGFAEPLARRSPSRLSPAESGCERVRLAPDWHPRRPPVSVAEFPGGRAQENAVTALPQRYPWRRNARRNRGNRRRIPSDDRRMGKAMSTDSDRSPAAKVMNDAIDLAIEGRSPYPERAAFIDADTSYAGHEIQRAADEGRSVVLVAADGSTRVLKPDLAAH